jgi:hypothetical protein
MQKVIKQQIKVVEFFAGNVLQISEGKDLKTKILT